MQAAHANRTHAFSLVELSIVLVILGLLVGGILAGKSLIHASELRKVTSDINKYRTAYFAFKDKYFALPGDMSNASSFWSGAVNGGGDGRLGWTLDGVNFWNHLQQAGLLEGSIAPLAAPVAALSIGTHVPSCPLGSCGYSMVYFSSWSNQPHLETRNILFMGTEGANNYTAGAVPNLLAEDLWNIDTKMDDGQSDLGLIIGTSCVTGSYPARTYLLSYTGGCKMLIDFFK